MSQELDNLVAVRLLKAEPASEAEVATLLQRAAALLTDAGNAALAPASRFNLAYDAAMSPSQAEVTDLLAQARALDRLVRKAAGPRR